MFRILGADGKEYGPVNADVLRQWIVERRAGANSRVRAEGSPDWKNLGEFPEFAATLAAGRQAVPPVVPPPLGSGAPTPRPGISRMAVASLVLGILGFCTAGITAVIGLALGLIALSGIRRSQGRVAGRGLAIGGICVSGFFLLAWSAILIPAAIRAKQKAQTDQCVSHVKQVAMAVRLFAEDNNGLYPPAANWCDAVVTNLPSPKILQCPAQPSRRSGYAFNRKVAGRTLSAVAPDTVMLFESSGAWNGTGGQAELLSRSRHGHIFVIGFADGSVRMMSQDELAALRWEP